MGGGRHARVQLVLVEVGDEAEDDRDQEGEVREADLAGREAVQPLENERQGLEHAVQDAPRESWPDEGW